MNYQEFENNTHKWGQIWIWSAACAILFVPILISLKYDAWPNLSSLFKGLLGVAPIYWTVGLIEIITFTPMLGTGGTYLSFVTGNVTALKVPAALNAMESAGVKANSEEGEIISTIAIATASIVTIIIIALGVFLFSALTPILNSPKLLPAFNNILPALFGALGIVYISKNWKLAIVPLSIMICIFVLFPSLSSSVGVLVPVAILISLGSARIMYKKGLL